MFNQKLSPNYGKGSYSIEANELELNLPVVLAERIRTRFESPNYQPPALPLVATKLLELSRAPDVEFRRVCAVLEQDALLAGKVLARAQSVVFGAATPARTLHDAMVRLGLATVRNIVLEMAFNVTIFRAPSFEVPMATLRRHSIAVAYAARMVARYTSVDAEYAFLCGLLHDVGIGASLILLGAERGEHRPSVEEAWPALALIHEDLSGQVAKHWKLAPEVQMVVGHHHRVRMGGFSHPSIAVLRLAEGFAEQIGAGMTSPDIANGFPLETPGEEEQQEAAKLLGVPDAAREKILADLEVLKPVLFT